MLFFIGYLLSSLAARFFVHDQLVQAFYQSTYWVDYRNWLRMFALYASYIIVFLFVSPATLHGKWLAQHYLSFVFDVIILSIFTRF